MKIHTNVSKIKGTKKSFNISVVAGGFIRVGGGAFSIGYENERGQRFELTIDQQAAEEALKEKQ